MQEEGKPNATSAAALAAEGFCSAVRRAQSNAPSGLPPFAAHADWVSSTPPNVCSLGFTKTSDFELGFPMK